MAKNSSFVEMVKAGPRPREKEATFGNRILSAAEVLTGKSAGGASYGRLSARGGRLPSISMVVSRPRTNSPALRNVQATQSAAQKAKKARLRTAAQIMAEAAGVSPSVLLGCTTIGATALRLRDVLLS